MKSTQPAKRAACFFFRARYRTDIMRTWGIIGIISALLFIVVAAAVYLVPEMVNRVDTSFAALIVPLQAYAWIRLFLVITVLGSAVGIVTVGIGFAYIARLSRARVMQLVILLVVVALANRFTKVFFARARPDPLDWFDPLLTFSFPSAHASATVALYGFTALYIYRRTHRLTYALLPLLIILFVGLSRIVLNAHHFSDVVGGYLLGLTLLACALALPFERFTKRHG